MVYVFEDEVIEVDLLFYVFEDWLMLVVFWVMVVCIFLQFFMCYVLNNSFVWIEEIVVNCLVVVVFLGLVMCVWQVCYIVVDLIFNFLLCKVGWLLEIVVDIILVVFFGYMCWLMWCYVVIVGFECMVIVDLLCGIVFYIVFVVFVLMFLCGVQNFVCDLICVKIVCE